MPSRQLELHRINKVKPGQSLVYLQFDAWSGTPNCYAYLVMNGSQLGLAGCQRLVLRKESWGLNILFMDPAKSLQCFKYMGVFLDREFWK